MGPNIFLLLVVAAVLLAAALFLYRQYWRRAGRLEKIIQSMAEGEFPESWLVHGSAWFHRVGHSLEAISRRQRDLETELGEASFNLKAVLGSMVEGVMVLDRRNRISLVNAEFLDLFGLHVNPLGRTALETLQEANVELFLREVMASGEEGNREVALRIKDRDDRQMHIKAVPIFDEAGEVNGLVAVFHDVSRIKKLERVRQEFVSAVSHELRTPLSIFRGYLETLGDTPDLPPREIQRVLGIMTRHSNRLNALVEDLFTLSRLESGRMEIQPVLLRLDFLVEQILEDYQQRVQERDAIIKLDAAPDLPAVEADKLKLEQVLLNLFDNALSYSRPPREVEISIWAEHGRVFLKVRDNGMGIPSADLPHIFERFYRVDKGRSRESGGTGLGLSIVKHILDLHGGSISAHSELGKWTEIVLSLPEVHEGPGWNEPSTEQKTAELPPAAKKSNGDISETSTRPAKAIHAEPRPEKAPANR